MNLPKRVARELAAAEAQELAFQTARAEHIAPAIQNVSELVEPLPVEPHAPVTPTVAAPAAPPVAPKEDFEHKYRVLQGMYEADVKVVKVAQRELDVRLTAVETAAPTAAAPPQMDQKDIDTFGADLIAMVKRYAEGQQAGTEARLTALEQKVGVVSERAEINAEQVFFEKLAALVPDAETINADPRWLAWLGTNDPIYGVPRQAALDNARSQLDVVRVSNIFGAFKASLPAPAAPDTTALSEQINPQGVGNPPPVPARPAVYLSEKSITDFYNDVGRGLYAGREAEMNAKENQINLAVAEGRVR